MTKAMKPLPDIIPSKKPYWDATKRHELVLLKCVDCGHYRHPLYGGESFMCPNCNSTHEPLWARSTGRGKLLTWTVVHQVFHPAFKEEVPYAVGVVLLEEGARMIANLRGVKPEEIKGDMEVEVIYEKLSEDITLPQFHPISRGQK